MVQEITQFDTIIRFTRWKDSRYQLKTDNLYYPVVVSGMTPETIRGILLEELVQQFLGKYIDEIEIKDGTTTRRKVLTPEEMETRRDWEKNNPDKYYVMILDPEDPTNMDKNIYVRGTDFDPNKTWGEYWAERKAKVKNQS